MGFDKEKIKQIKGLMVLGAVLVLAIIYSSSVVAGIVLAINIAKPFIYGGQSLLF